MNKMSASTSAVPRPVRATRPDPPVVLSGCHWVQSFAEVWIAELEEFLKKMTKMMQVQLELVDMKIGVQIEGMKSQLEESIADQAAAFYTELRDLNAQTSESDSSLLKLKDLELLTKREVVDLVNHVVDARASEGQGQVLTLDDVRAVVSRLVEVEIEKHAAAGLGRVDYALSMGGASIRKRIGLAME